MRPSSSTLPSARLASGSSGSDGDHLRPGLARLGREPLAASTYRASSRQPSTSSGGELRGPRAIVLERRGALFDADDGRHLDGHVPGADVDRHRVLGVRDDLARELAAALEVDLVRDERSGDQRDHDQSTFHSVSLRAGSTRRLRCGTKRIVSARGALASGGPQSVRRVRGLQQRLGLRHRRVELMRPLCMMTRWSSSRWEGAPLVSRRLERSGGDRGSPGARCLRSGAGHARSISYREDGADGAGLLSRVARLRDAASVDRLLQPSSRRRGPRQSRRDLRGLPTAERLRLGEGARSADGPFAPGPQTGAPHRDEGESDQERFEPQAPGHGGRPEPDARQARSRGGESYYSLGLEHLFEEIEESL